MRTGKVQNEPNEEDHLKALQRQSGSVYGHESGPCDVTTHLSTMRH